MAAARVEAPLGTVVCFDPLAQRYQVQGRTGVYIVEPDPDNPPYWRCDCPHYRFRCIASLRHCKHITRVCQYVAEQNACPGCKGQGWIVPTGAVRFVNVATGQVDLKPLKCLGCDGSGQRRKFDE